MLHDKPSRLPTINKFQYLYEKVKKVWVFDKGNYDEFEIIEKLCEDIFNGTVANW